jgi:hypothetical protein
MKIFDLQSLTVLQLVERFAELALAQDRAQMFGKIKLYNRLYDDVVAVKNELASRPGDQRSALMSLYSHSNPHVRLKAAQWSLAVAPVAARQVLQEISDRNIYPQAADARQSLEALDRGESKLI